MAYAYLLENGFDIERLYENKLNELYISDPNDSNFFELEIISGDIKASICYIKEHIDYPTINVSKFGKELMKLLKPIYYSLSIDSFGELMYSLSESLAGNLQDEEPFIKLCYADNPLLWEDKNTARKKFEEMLSYYDN
ncbi:MAG: hypothetical protein ACI4JK_01245 [Oscillospiraceae bacterium]